MDRHGGEHSTEHGAPRARLIAYVYFYLGRTLVAYAPLYSGESSAGPEVAERAAARDPLEYPTPLLPVLSYCKRVLLQARASRHPHVYNSGKALNSDDSARKQSD